MFDHRTGAQAARRRRDELDNPCGEEKRVHVFQERTLNSGAQNFNRYDLSGFTDHGLVHLCQRCSSDRFGEALENLVNINTEFGFNFGLGDICVESRQRVLQNPQFPSQFHANDVGAR